jgi:hypothetical protein
LQVPASVGGSNSQTWVAPQACPQAPQFCGSVASTAHSLPQGDVPAPHRQTPSLQICPLRQALPQVPQFLESAAESMQPCAQRVVPA